MSFVLTLMNKVFDVAEHRFDVNQPCVDVTEHRLDVNEYCF